MLLRNHHIFRFFRSNTFHYIDIITGTDFIFFIYFKNLIIKDFQIFIIHFLKFFFQILIDLILVSVIL